MNAFEVEKPDQAYYLLESAKEYVRTIYWRDHPGAQHTARAIESAILELLKTAEWPLGTNEIEPALAEPAAKRWQQYRHWLQWQEPANLEAPLPAPASWGSDCRRGGSCGLGGLLDMGDPRSFAINRRYWSRRAIRKVAR